MPVNISQEQVEKGLKAIKERDWVTYANVMWDNVARNGPDSPLKSALLKGPSTPEEEDALRAHNDMKDSAALSLEFIDKVAIEDNEVSQNITSIIAHLLVDNKQKNIMRKIIQRVEELKAKKK